MFYICAICMIKRSPLLTLTPNHRKILEGIVSPLIDTTPLKGTIMLLCGDCDRLIQTMEKFQNTAFVGVKYLLSLHAAMEGNPDEALLPAPPIIEKQSNKHSPEADLIAYNMMPIPIKEEPADSVEKPEDLGTPKVTMMPVPIKEEPADSLEKHVKSTPKETELPPPAAIQHQLNEEVDLKSEPASEAEDEGEYLQDSESTVTCDSDRGNEEDFQLAAITKNYLSRERRAGRGDDVSPESGEQENGWYVRQISEAVVLAALKRARAAALLSDAPYRCDKCALVFKDQWSCNLHNTLHYKSAGLFICHICTQRQRTAERLREHLSRHLTRYTCLACRHSTSDAEAVKQHRCTTPDTRTRKRKHKQEAQSEKNKEESQKNKEAPQKSKEETQSQKSKELQVKCGECKETCMDKTEFADHFDSTVTTEITFEVPVVPPLHVKRASGKGKLKSKRTRLTPDPGKLSPFLSTLHERSEGETERGDLPLETSKTTSLAGGTIVKHPENKHPNKLAVKKHPKKEIIQDCDTKADAIFETWRIPPESDDESENEEQSAPIELTRSEPAIIDLDPAVGEWLRRQDYEADRTLHDLLPEDLTFDWSKDHAH